MSKLLSVSWHPESKLQRAAGLSFRAAFYRNPTENATYIPPHLCAEWGELQAPPFPWQEAAVCMGRYIWCISAHFFIYVFIITSPNSALKKYNWPYVFCLAVCQWPVCLRSWVIARALRVSCLQEVVSSPHLWLYTVLTPSSEVTHGGPERGKMLAAFSTPFRCVMLQAGT